MRITFILPGPNPKPIGGYRVVYDYADRLAERGHQVTILFSLLDPFLRPRPPLWFRNLKCQLSKDFSPPWYRFKNQVTLQVIPEINDQTVPDGEGVFATWWASAYSVSKLKKEKGCKFYLIQHYEKWAGDIELLHQTYKLGLNNIVIAGWLKEKLESVGAEVTAHIPNGINLEQFKPMIPIEERNPYSITMMYHLADWKGSSQGIAAIEMVKKQYPQLEATLFSVYPRPRSLPDWIRFIQNPTQEKLVTNYSQHAIFLSPSWAEGWPLPPAEALACGCALVSTDIGGVKDYALAEKTALLSPPKDPTALAANIMRLLEDHALLRTIAQTGLQQITNFSWERAVSKMEKTIITSRGEEDS